MKAIKLIQTTLMLALLSVSYAAESQAKLFSDNKYRIRVVNTTQKKVSFDLVVTFSPKNHYFSLAVGSWTKQGLYPLNDSNARKERQHVFLEPGEEKKISIPLNQHFVASVNKNFETTDGGMLLNVHWQLDHINIGTRHIFADKTFGMAQDNALATVDCPMNKEDFSSKFNGTEADALLRWNQSDWDAYVSPEVRYNTTGECKIDYSEE
jgi:hypothetical protein